MKVTNSQDVLCRKMVEAQLTRRNIKDKNVLSVMEAVPREFFVHDDLKPYAYEDRPLPIGYGQTISQPYIVAFMLEKAQLNPKDRVLEVGTGSGYEAALLGNLVKEVYSLDIVQPLVDKAKKLIKNMKLNNVHISYGNGVEGWKEHAPFDVILVTAQFPRVPPALIKQLAVGGRLLMPLGEKEDQVLTLLKKESDHEITSSSLIPVRFVPLLESTTPIIFDKSFYLL